MLIFVFSEFFQHLCISSCQFAFPDLTLHCLSRVILPACVQLFPHRFLLLLFRLFFLTAETLWVEDDSSTEIEGGGMYKHRSMMFLKLKQSNKFRAAPEQIIFQSKCVLNRNCFVSIPKSRGRKGHRKFPVSNTEFSKKVSFPLSRKT